MEEGSGERGREREMENRGDRKMIGEPDQEVQHKFSEQNNRKNLKRGNHHENLPKDEGHERDSVYEVELRDCFPQ